MLSKRERIEEFLRRLERAEPAGSAAAAFALLSRILNEVENELSGIPFDPTKWQSDGRLYPPQEDHKRNVEGRSDLIRYRSARHNTFISVDGGIKIIDLESDQCVLNKPGLNGRTIE